MSDDTKAWQSGYLAGKHEALETKDVEPVGIFKRDIDNANGAFEYLVHSGAPLVVGDKLYTTPPDQSARIAELEAKLSEWEKLKDPNTLRINLLRGIPARLSQTQLLHILGSDNIVAQLEAEKAELLEALKECVNDMQGWGAYASEYFQNKHDLEGDIAKYKAIIEKYEVNNGQTIQQAAATPAE